METELWPAPIANRTNEIHIDRGPMAWSTVQSWTYLGHMSIWIIVDLRNIIINPTSSYEYLFFFGRVSLMAATALGSPFLGRVCWWGCFLLVQSGCVWFFVCLWFFVFGWVMGFYQLLICWSCFGCCFLSCRPFELYCACIFGFVKAVCFVGLVPCSLPRFGPC